MSRLFDRGHKPAGASPGTVVYIGEKKDAPISVTRVRYSGEFLEENTILDLSECRPNESSGAVEWYNIDGIHDSTLLQTIGEAFHLHPLVIEDIVNTNQRPKIEDFDQYVFLTLKMITYDREGSQILPEHVSLILGKGFVLSFLEDAGDVFEPLRQRLRTNRGRIRKAGADYLAYALIDSIVDHYFDVLEKLGEDIEEVEEEVMTVPTQDTLHTIHTLKRELIYLRRAVWPLREAVSTLQRDECELITDGTRIFIRDLYDHVIQVIDSVETLRDIVSGMLDIYLSSASNKMNQIMKVLTVMSSIFIPLTFIAGVYGMNFKYMPELETPWGYPCALLFMAAIAVSLLVVFRRRGWI